MNKKVVIAIIIIVVVIIIGVVGFLIYRSNKRKKEEAAAQMLILQQQLAQNPNMPPTQKAGILEQIANLAAMVAAAKAQGQGGTGTPPYIPGMGMPPYAPANPPANTPVPPAGFPLKTGSNTKNAPSGKNYVQNLQGALNAKCGKNLVMDGVYGPLTQTAVTQCLGGVQSVSWDKYREYLTV